MTHLAKITQIHKSRMTPMCFEGLADHTIVICEFFYIVSLFYISVLNVEF